MSYFIYNLIIHILFLLALPVYLIKILFTSKYRETWRDRFAITPIFRNRINAKNIWIHAASAGEVRAAKALIDRLYISHADIKLFLTTSTHSGFKMACKELKDKVEIHMLPLDLPWLIGPAVKRVRPFLTVIIEPDIWPNFIKYASRQGKLLMINSWFDKKTLRKIEKVSGLLPAVLSYFNRITVQSEYDRKKFNEVLTESKIKVTGNIKYDQIDPLSKVKSNKLKSSLKIMEGDLVFIAGSTHKGEEEKLLRVYKVLKGKYKNLLMIIAPRHIERSEEIANICRRIGLDSVKKTVLARREKRSEDIIILDTMGELVDIYPLGMVTFMGGTLIKQGGHNILEALAVGNPVIFGPYYYNFREIFEIAVENNIGYKINSEKELLEVLSELMEDNERLAEINNRAKRIIDENKGALSKTVSEISTMINIEAEAGHGNKKN